MNASDRVESSNRFWLIGNSGDLGQFAGLLVGSLTCQPTNYPCQPPEIRLSLDSIDELKSVVEALEVEREIAAGKTQLITIDPDT
jgi:hypothetical protein